MCKQDRDEFTSSLGSKILILIDIKGRINKDGLTLGLKIIREDSQFWSFKLCQVESFTFILMEQGSFSCLDRGSHIGNKLILYFTNNPEYLIEF